MTVPRRKAAVVRAEGTRAVRLHDGPGSGGAPATDICSALFDVCLHCQETHLDAVGATCMFDVDGGQVPCWMYEVLRDVIEAVVLDIASHGSRTRGAAVGITLRRSGNYWALAIAENLSRDAGAHHALRRLAVVRALTNRLACVCRILPNAWGSTVAIAFPISDIVTAGDNCPPADRCEH